MNFNQKFIIKASKGLYLKTKAKTIGVAKIKLYGDSPLQESINILSDNGLVAAKKMMKHNVIYNESSTSLNSFILTKNPPISGKSVLTYKKFDCHPNAYGFSTELKPQWLSQEPLLVKKEYIKNLYYDDLLQPDFIKVNEQAITEHMLTSNQSIDLITLVLNS